MDTPPQSPDENTEPVLHRPKPARRRRVDWRALLIALGVALVFCAALYASSELMVFGRAWYPSTARELWAFITLPLRRVEFWSPPTWIALGTEMPRQFVCFVPVALLSWLVLRGERKRARGAVLLLLLVPLFLLAFRWQVAKRQKDMEGSCGNHSNFWRFVLPDRVDFVLPLPDTTEFEDFLRHTQEPDSLRHLHSSTCPGYALAGTKTGVAYVGGGLKLHSLSSHRVLLAFCDWRCHPPPYDHLHCLWWEHNQLSRECSNNPKVIKSIEEALALAQSGQVPYSPAAVAVLRTQLEQRKGYAK